MNIDLIISWLSMAIGFGSILAIASLGELLTEKVGHLNLGVPGIMYFSAICSYICCMYYEKGNENPSALVVILIAVLVSFAVGALFGTIYSLICVTFQCNQNVMGLAISTFGVGFGKFLSSAFKLTSYKLSFAGSLFNAGIPVLKDIPYVGEIFFNQGMMVYVTILLCILASIFLFKTRTGLNLRAVGENPATADSAGINVTKYKYIATIIGCGFAGFGGMMYVLDFNGGLWATNNNIESIGWLAVALVIFATWKPLSLLWAAPLFAFCFWAFNFIPSMLGKYNFTGLNDLIQTLPYVVTIIILVINSLKKKKENQPPQSLGLSYFRENR